MKKVLLIFLLIIFLSATSFATQKKVVNNNSNGFQIILDKKTIQIDNQKRDFTDYKIYQKKGLIYLKYFTRSHIKKSGLIIIKKHKVIFDSKEALKNRAGEIITNIYSNYLRLIKMKGYSPGPEFCNFKLYDYNSLKINNLTYRTKLNGKDIYIDVNFQSNYKKYIRFIFNKNGKLQSFSNKTGIVSCSNVKIGTINDPDGYTNVRLGPKLKYRAFRKVYTDDVFQIIGSKEHWYRIFTSQNANGYIHKSRVKIIPKY